MPITNHAGKWGVITIGVMACALTFRGVHVYQENKRQASDEAYNRAHQVPNTFVRSQFIGYSTSDIAQIQIYGSNFGRFSDDPIVVSDPKAIATLFHSLQNATTTSRANAPQNGLSGGDTLQINFKLKGGQQREPLQVPFNASRAYRWYGTEFENALNSIPQYQTKRATM